MTEEYVRSAGYYQLSTTNTIATHICNCCGFSNVFFFLFLLLEFRGILEHELHCAQQMSFMYASFICLKINDLLMFILFVCLFYSKMTVRTHAVIYLYFFEAIDCAQYTNLPNEYKYWTQRNKENWLHPVNMSCWTPEHQFENFAEDFFSRRNQ